MDESVDLHPLTALARHRLEADDLDVDVDAALVVFWLNRLARRYTAWVQATLKPEGIDDSEAAILVALRLGGEPHAVTPRWLRSMLMLTSGGVTRAVDRLVAAGYVERDPDPDDGRSCLVRITRSGNARAGEIIGVLAERHAAIAGAVAPPADAPSLLQCVDRLLALYDDLASPA